MTFYIEIEGTIDNFLFWVMGKEGGGGGGGGRIKQIPSVKRGGRGGGRGGGKFKKLLVCKWLGSGGGGGGN